MRQFPALARLQPLGFVVFITIILVGCGQSAHVEELISDLRSPIKDTREAAVKELGGIKDSRAIKPLSEVLTGDTDAAVRSDAATSLGYIRDPSTTEALVRALRDKDGAVQRSAAHALGAIKSPGAVDGLIEALNTTSDDGMFGECTRALGEIDDSGTRTALLAGVAGTQSQQAKLIRVLQFLNSSWGLQSPRPFTSAMIDPLAAYMGNADYQVRRTVVLCLREIKDPKSISSLIEALSDSDPNVRLDAASAVGYLSSQMGDRRAVGPLVAVLHDPNHLVRIEAVHALGGIGDPQVVKPLIAGFKDREVPLDVVARALAPKASAVVDFLLDPDRYVRMGAAKTLEIAINAETRPGNTPDPRLESGLLQALNRHDVATVAGAYRFFLDRADPGSEGLLVDAINAFGDKEMALAFMSSKKSKVSSAGCAWALSRQLDLVVNGQRISLACP